MDDSMDFQQPRNGGHGQTAVSRGPGPRRTFNKLIDEETTHSYKTQLSINKSFGSNEFAQRFCVCNPRKSQGGNYIVYTVFGEDP